MNLSDYIYENIFEEKEKFTYLYELLWANLEEDGYVITDEPDSEIDALFKAVAIKNLINEFVYRVYDEFNETSSEEVIERLNTLGISEEKAVEYCKTVDGVSVVEGNDEKTIKNAFELITEQTADKLLELFSADDLFDYFFTATYDFEQDFTFAFEDVDEFQAFVDSNTERLDDYKEEYPAVMSWIESGMIV